MFSRGGSLVPPASADTRYTDDVIVSQAMQLRARMVPYSYTSALRCWLTPDQPFVRPVYVEFPDDTLAVAERQRGHYMYGSAILVQPITAPLSTESNLTSHWLHFPPLSNPSEAWVERSSGRCFRGNETVTLGYRLEETAEFIRPGSIIPMVRTPTAQWEQANTCSSSSSGGSGSSSSSCAFAAGAKPPPAMLLGAAGRVPNAIVWHVWFGNATTGGGELLEDDGKSSDYQKGAFTQTISNYTLSSKASKSMWCSHHESARER